MKNKISFITRLYAHASEEDKCLLAWPLSPKSQEISPELIYWEQQRNDELRVIRSLEISYAENDIIKTLNGKGEAYVGCSDEHMAPYAYEKLNINIPSDNVDIDHVWKLYEEWLIKWTGANELRGLVAEPIREGM